MTDIEHWENEAMTDPRYKKGRWGTLADSSDEKEVIKGIIAEVGRDIDDGIPDTTVVEIGCGPGRLLVPLARKFPNVSFIGVDHAHNMIEIAKRKTSKLANIELFTYGDLAFLRPESVNVVFAVELFQHLPAIAVQGFIGQAQHILMEGGIMVFQFVVNDQPDTPFCFHHNRDDIIAAAKQAGFSCSVDWYSAVHPEWCWVRAYK